MIGQFSFVSNLIGLICFSTNHNSSSLYASIFQYIKPSKSAISHRHYQLVMKYFTPASLTLFALNSLLLTVSASETPAAAVVAAGTTASADPAPVVPNSSFIDDARRTAVQVVEAVKGVFTTPKNLIKAQLIVPKPLDAAKVVEIKPSEAVCQFGKAEEFWDTLLGPVSSTDDAFDAVKIEKTLFCPNAVAYLKDLTSSILLSRARGDELRAVLAALMLRRATLVGLYSTSFIDDNYLVCYNALWDRVQGTQPGTENWPCSSSTSCDAAGIKSAFSTFVSSTPACKAILKDQLDVYADRVAEAATANNISTPSFLREAILENLNSAPHLSLPIFTVYDSVLETNKKSAVAAIDETLKNVKTELTNLFPGSTIYADAEKCFNNRMASLSGNTDITNKTASTANDPASTGSNNNNAPNVTEANKPSDNNNNNTSSNNNNAPVKDTKTDDSSNDTKGKASSSDSAQSQPEAATKTDKTEAVTSTTESKDPLPEKTAVTTSTEKKDDAPTKSDK